MNIYMERSGSGSPLLFQIVRFRGDTMKRFFLVLMALMFLLPSCCVQAESYQKFQHYFFGTFDTIITLIGYTQTPEEFQQYAALTESEMRRYHEIFDQYNPYDGVNNLYAVNAQAGEAPAAAESELIELLLQIREWHSLYGTETNPAMGAVLRLWHNAREGGVSIPEEGALLAASEHCNYDDVIIDEENGTIFYNDPEILLDLGAVAKGYAAQLTADALKEAGFSSFILNAGGNVVCGGAPMDGRTQWTVAIEDVDAVSTRHKIGAVNQSIVTSGDYQRYYEVDGVRYHHLIDPATLYPASHVHSVSVIHPDSGLADFLSTAAFVLPYEQSRALIESVPDACGVWLLADGSEYWTDGFQNLLDLVK